MIKEQISDFAANSLEVENKNGAKQLIISTRGWDTLTPEQQVNMLLHCYALLFIVIQTQYSNSQNTHPFIAKKTMKFNVGPKIHLIHLAVNL